MNRDDLEAFLWRVIGFRATAGLVDSILAAADAYASLESGRLLAARSQYRPPLEASLTASRRAVLLQCGDPPEVTVQRRAALEAALRDGTEAA
jgi:hypothetical protein